MRTMMGPDQVKGCWQAGYGNPEHLGDEFWRQHLYSEPSSINTPPFKTKT